MNTQDIMIARIYLHEAGADYKKMLEYLHDECKVSGVTVFRGITGFGKSGKYHSSSLMDMSLDLPVVIEFFDEPEKMQDIIEVLSKRVKPGHIVFWSAGTNH